MAQNYVPPSPKMRNYLISLAGSQLFPDLGDTAQERVTEVNRLITDRELDKYQVMGLIDRLKVSPLDVDGALVPPGVYRRNGDVFVVQLNRDKSRLYAKKLVQIGGKRLVDATEEVVKAEFEYAPGALSTLRPEDQLTLTEAREYLLRYTHCMICGRFLKAASSVIDSIGPVCRQMFRSEPEPEVDQTELLGQLDELDQLTALLGGSS